MTADPDNEDTEEDQPIDMESSVGEEMDDEYENFTVIAVDSSIMAPITFSLLKQRIIKVGRRLPDAQARNVQNLEAEIVSWSDPRISAWGSRSSSPTRIYTCRGGHSRHTCSLKCWCRTDT